MGVTWQFRSADWDRLSALLNEVDWTFLQELSPDDGAQRLTRVILQAARVCIKRRQLEEVKSTHPWLNERVMEAVEAKRKAAGTPEEKEAATRCSKVILAEYNRGLSACEANSWVSALDRKHGGPRRNSCNYKSKDCAAFQR